METLATVCFALAVLHTFAVKRLAHWAHQHPPGSVREILLHFLAETEVIFGLWAAALFLAIVALRGLDGAHDVCFRKELAALTFAEDRSAPVPKWLTATHLVFLGLVVGFAHHPDVFLAASCSSSGR
jgi:hypothetical protein